MVGITLPASSFSPFRQPFRAPQRARAIALLLCVVLCLAQSLAFGHRVLHAPGLPQVLESATGELFAGHEVSDCELYDGAAGAGPLPALPQLVLPLLLPTARFAWLEGEFVARWVALFDARGPPLTR